MKLDWYMYVSLIMIIAIVGYFLGVVYGKKLGFKKLQGNKEKNPPC